MVILWLGLGFMGIYLGDAGPGVVKACIKIVYVGFNKVSWWGETHFCWYHVTSALWQSESPMTSSRLLLASSYAVID